jgi:hypothetical protein
MNVGKRSSCIIRKLSFWLSYKVLYRGIFEKCIFRMFSCAVLLSYDTGIAFPYFQLYFYITCCIQVLHMCVFSLFYFYLNLDINDTW